MSGENGFGTADPEIAEGWGADWATGAEGLENPSVAGLSVEGEKRVEDCREPLVAHARGVHRRLEACQPARQLFWETLLTAAGLPIGVQGGLESHLRVN